MKPKLASSQDTSLNCLEKITVITITIFVVTTPNKPNKKCGWEIQRCAESLAKQISVSIQSTTANLEHLQEKLFKKKKKEGLFIHLACNFLDNKILACETSLFPLFPHSTAN